jgi:myo-inositol-1(or 4)-monophosphatase
VPIAQPELAPLGALALEAARHGAETVNRARSGGFTARPKSSHRDLVTEVDTAAERAIADLIGRVRPGDGVLGEEGGQREGCSGVRWIIDPIDGTANFVHHRSDYAVAVAADLDLSWVRQGWPFGRRARFLIMGSVQ